MRTNPNIITSGNQMAPPQLPDVNAMMQTRTAGMENIYALEQQRAAQAQAAQKEQEAEAMKALSPAIAAAFSDPSDAGLDAALALVPPQYQGAAKAQLDQIRALPDTNRRKDLIRAGLVQDEAGRTLLGQLEMTASQRANLDVQREQNDLRRTEIALTRQKQQLDAQGLGAWELKEGEGGFFWTNPRTREVVRANVTGTAPAPGPSPIPLPDAVTPRQPAPGAPETAPISTERPPAEFRPKQTKDGKTSESERVAAYNAGRTLLSAADIFNTIKSDPDAVAPGALETAVGLFVDPNFVRSAERQIVSSAQYEAVDALLTLATGAAYNQEQRNSQIQRYIPLYSDEPETREYKKRALLDTIQVAKAKSGAAWSPEMDAALEKLGLVNDTGARGAAPAAADTSGFKIRSVREK